MPEVGKLHSDRFVVSYESLLRDCPQCGNAIPLGGPVSRVQCPECRSEVSIPAGVWDLLYKRASIDGVLRTDYDADMDPAEIADPQSRFKIDVRRKLHAAPLCIHCGATASTESLSSSCDCNCGKRIDYAPRTKSFNGVELTHVCATEIDDAPADATPVEPQQAAAPVAMACPLCSANLQVSADSSRTINCEYCSGSIYLPDDLWRRFHPVKTVKRWTTVHRVTPKVLLSKAKYFTFGAPLACLVVYGLTILLPGYLSCASCTGFDPNSKPNVFTALALLAVSAVVLFALGYKRARPFYEAARRFGKNQR